MSTEIVPTATAVVQHRGDDIQVTASSGDEMAQSQTALIEWSTRKIAAMEAEAKEMREATEHAKARKWKFATLAKHALLAERRVEFYRKLKAALEAGYIIVPTFPVEVFAIRATKERPTKIATVSTDKWTRTKFERAITAPAGEGEYVNPAQTVHAEPTGKTNEHGSMTYHRFNFQQWDDVEFPLNMAKPQIMEATSRAMALKIFDDFGVLPSTRRNVDPIIVARIRDPRVPHKWAPKMVSFIIKWHLDTRTL